MDLSKSLKPEAKLAFLKNIKQHEQRSPEWFAQRENKLTSSDAATALDINPYQKPVELLFKKCGAGKPFEGNVATLHGQKYEDIAIDYYCKAMGKRNHEFGLIDFDAVVRENDLYTLSKYPKGIYWMAGSTDGIAEDLSNKEDLIVLEVKCPYRRKIKFGECPEYYYPQVQLNMAILNIEKADFIEFIPENHLGNKLPMQLNIVRIQRDRNWFDKNVPILEAFWKEIEKWRTKDITTHPEYLKYHKPEKKMKILTLDFSKPNLLNEDSSEDNVFLNGQSMFLDSDSDED